jgi:hypothetical protein
MQSDLNRLFIQFSNSDLNLEHINGSLITLIPKKGNPMIVNDYEPISLLNSSMKLLTKLLATRLQSVMDYWLLFIKTNMDS